MPVDVLELSIHSPIYDEKMAEKSKADLILTRSAGQMPGNATSMIGLCQEGKSSPDALRRSAGTNSF